MFAFGGEADMIARHATGFTVQENAFGVFKRR
jgi:hypothetical protein